jgi:hypothetical protein
VRSEVLGYWIICVIVRYLVNCEGRRFGRSAIIEPPVVLGVFAANISFFRVNNRRYVRAALALAHRLDLIHGIGFKLWNLGRA